MRGVCPIDSFGRNLIEAMMTAERKTPFEKIGGRPMIEKVVELFYDKVYAHPWIGQYFAHIPRDHIESQQSDFMSRMLNGPKSYSGRLPKDAHVHMVISDELFDLRNQLLSEAMVEIGISEEMQAVWLGIDESFRKVIVKNEDQAERRYRNDSILDFKKTG